MSASETHPNGWISVPTAPRFVMWAKTIRAERDQQYGNIYRETETDERWVGDLGEIVFKSWLNHVGIAGFQWITDNAAGNPDFIMPPDTKVGVKTVKRKVPPRAGYTAQVTAQHANEPIDYFFFMSYEITKAKMWLLGGISKEDFLHHAVYYPAGARVHANYQIREGHEIYNVDIDRLTPPKEWIDHITI